MLLFISDKMDHFLCYVYIFYYLVFSTSVMTPIILITLSMFESYSIKEKKFVEFANMLKCRHGSETNRMASIKTQHVNPKYLF